MTPTRDQEYNRKELSSLANPECCKTIHVHLDWSLDFDRQILSGLCKHKMQIVTSASVETVDFDSFDLVIEEVEVQGERTSYCHMSPVDPFLGTKISVTIPNDLRFEGSEFEVCFRYRTTKKATAIQWLKPEHTHSGQHPYVFTQSQAIHARSLLPCQDSPGVKFPYSAKVKAPQWCTVLMSALEDDTVTTVNSRETGTFYFVQPAPISAYLIALAAGDLDFRDISRRVRIWAEPCIVDEAAEEFSQTEDILQAAESLVGPYLWTRYDVLIMPHSFPYGGMENPCLTFATPTLLAGDKSLADVLAHEIAHSWTGNLVTNATWNHFWLNEGWTVWLERRIMAKVNRNEDYMKISAEVGWKHLKDDVARMGNEHKFTQLIWPLSGEDPDEAFSSVPYEKGFNLLYYLESLMGQDRFLGFAKAYILKYRFLAVTTGEFRDFFIEYFLTFRPPIHHQVTVVVCDDEEETEFLSSSVENEQSSSASIINSSSMSAFASTMLLSSSSTSTLASVTDASLSRHQTIRKTSKKTAAITNDSSSSSSSSLDAFDLEGYLTEVRTLLASIKWDLLLHAPGMPFHDPDFSNALAMAAQVLARRWITVAERLRNTSTNSDLTAIFSKDDMMHWTTMQINIFLETLLDRVEETNCPLCDSALLAMDSKYDLSENANSEIKFRWQSLCLRSEVSWIVPHVVSFVSSQGRMKFIRPLYRALYGSTMGHKVATDTFDKFKHRYHPIARKMVSGDFKATTHPQTSHNIVTTAATFFFQRTTIFVSILLAILVFFLNAAYFNKLTFRGEAI